jgi:phage terminase small subunit
MPLTLKQKAFADYYIETGNATEAARRAGYKGRNNTLAVTGNENLRKPNISAYISKRMAEIDAGRIATADEVMKFYTSVMRGEVKDQFGLEAQLTDRLNAGKELMKRFAAVDDRQKDALDRLDALFEEFRNAVNEEAE